MLCFVLDCLSSYFKPHYNLKIILHNSMHCKNWKGLWIENGSQVPLQSAVLFLGQLSATSQRFSMVKMGLLSVWW